MTDLTFSQAIADSIYEQDDPFPVYLDATWQWLGYATKQATESTLLAIFEEGIDYTITELHDIKLSVEGIRMLALASRTQIGRETYNFLANCQNKLKQETKLLKLNLAKPYGVSL